MISTCSIQLQRRLKHDMAETGKYTYKNYELTKERLFRMYTTPKKKQF